MRKIQISIMIAILTMIMPPITLAATPIGAKAVYLRGVVYLEPKDAPRTQVQMDQAFAEGDKIITADDGILEIMLENGNLVRIDHNSEFVIKSLHREEETNSTFSIFNLILGRVKSSVARLATADSKFEYITKAAIVGVAGTPPWVLEFDGETASVDLLGLEGEDGSVYIQGFDLEKTIVHLLANQATKVRTGFAPQPPFTIPLERRKMLDQIIPFSFQQKDAGTDGQSAQAPQETPPDQQLEEKPKETSQSSTPSVADSLVSDSISNSISMPVKPTGGAVDSVTGASRMTSSEQGTVGEVGAGQQAPSIAKFQIQVNF